MRLGPNRQRDRATVRVDDVRLEVVEMLEAHESHHANALLSIECPDSVAIFVARD